MGPVEMGDGRLTWLNGTSNLIACRGCRFRGFVDSRFLRVWRDGLRDLITNALTSASS